MLKNVKPCRMASGTHSSGLVRCQRANPQTATIPNWRAAYRRCRRGSRSCRARSSSMGIASRSCSLKAAISFQ